MELRDQFRRRIFDEVQGYKETILKYDADELLQKVFQTDQYIIIYEVLLEISDNIPTASLEKLMEQPVGIISTIYHAWMETHGDAFMEIKKFIMEDYYGSKC